MKSLDGNELSMFDLFFFILSIFFVIDVNVSSLLESNFKYSELNTP